jgi:hypothetical protein
VLYFDAMRRRYCREMVKTFARLIRERALRGFDNIEAEADAVARNYFQQEMSRPSNGDDYDPGGAAEEAPDRGLQAYQDLIFVRGQVMGLAIAGTFHLWERLLKEFLRGERPSESSRIDKADFHRLIDWLEEAGWPIRGEQFFGSLSRLRLIANAIKHGDGPACDELLETAPELFTNFEFEILNEGRGAEHLNLTEEHLDAATTAVLNFFAAFPERLALEPS